MHWVRWFNERVWLLMRERGRRLEVKRPVARYLAPGEGELLVAQGALNVPANRPRVNTAVVVVGRA
jgi:hypothetical protein